MFSSRESPPMTAADAPRSPPSIAERLKALEEDGRAGLEMFREKVAELKKGYAEEVRRMQEGHVAEQQATEKALVDSREELSAARQRILQLEQRVAVLNGDLAAALKESDGAGGRAQGSAGLLALINDQKHLIRQQQAALQQNPANRTPSPSPPPPPPPPCDSKMTQTTSHHHHHHEQHLQHTGESTLSASVKPAAPVIPFVEADVRRMGVLKQQSMVNTPRVREVQVVNPIPTIHEVSKSPPKNVGGRAVQRAVEEAGRRERVRLEVRKREGSAKLAFIFASFDARKLGGWGEHEALLFHRTLHPSTPFSWPSFCAHLGASQEASLTSTHIACLYDPSYPARVHTSYPHYSYELDSDFETLISGQPPAPPV